MILTPKKCSFTEMLLFMSLSYLTLPILRTLFHISSILHLPLFKHLLLIFPNHPFPHLHAILHLFYLKLLTLHLLEFHLELNKNPSYLQDFICPPSHTNHTNHLTNKYPLYAYHSYSHLSNSHSLFALSIATHIEPKTYVETIKHDCWKQAMKNELTALNQSGTW
jgi:hypothetical protein